MNAKYWRRWARSALTATTVAGLLVVGAAPSNASGVYGGGDCWATNLAPGNYSYVQVTKGTCSKVGAMHKWAISAMTGYTDWNYTTSYDISSDYMAYLTIPYGRAYD